jgi:hypothetical protein
VTASYLTAEQYAELLAVRGLRVVRLPDNRWMAQCPLHDDHTPSLSISQGRHQDLVLHCFGCGGEFTELLAGVSVCRQYVRRSARRVQHVLLEEVEYLAVHDVLGLTSDARVGIRFTEGDHSVCSPPGNLEVHALHRRQKWTDRVLRDLVDRANEHSVTGWTDPIAYGTKQEAARLGTHPGTLTRALKELERAGCIERVRRLPLLGRPEAGAWTWRLVVAAA